MTDNAPPPGPSGAADPLVPVGWKRFTPLLAAVGISIAIVGYVVGIREPRTAERPAAAVQGRAAGAPVAVDYSDLPTARLRPNAGQEQSLSQLRYDKPGVFDAVTRTEEMKLAALADRARNRAFDGAPPTIPHPVETQSAASCLACHGEGVKVGDRVASKMSHAHLSNCTQCHAEGLPVGLPFRAEPPSENTFTGVYRAGPGTRASPGAPPTIPHHTWMRENCTSCHGLLTRPGTRTTHPWLTNCTQCHAPSAALDQVDFTGTK